MRLSERADQERVERICEAVAGGFNAMICGAGPDGWVEYGEGLEVHFRPFAHEGAAMGFSLRHPTVAGRKRFEIATVAAHPSYKYLYYVGLGLWHGYRHGRSDRLDAALRGLDPMYRMLAYDGFGFRYGFFDYEGIENHAVRLAGLAGYRGRAAMQGVGRSLWFRFMNDADRLIEEISRFDASVRADLAGGLGLAATFVDADRPERVWALAKRVPQEWQSDFQLGMSFAYRARQLNDATYFESCVSRLPTAAERGVRRSLEACDRIEGAVRAEELENGYGRWRDGLSEWINKNLTYPLESSRSEQTEAA